MHHVDKVKLSVKGEPKNHNNEHENRAEFFLFVVESVREQQQ
jgi:hypothetical protein